MPNNPSADQPAKSPANAVPATDFAMQMHAFWEKNRSFILLLCVVVLLAFVGREGWDYFAARREAAIQEEYTKATASPEKLSAFAVEYPSHALAGVAWLRLADGQYTAGDFKSATTSYQRAASALQAAPLKSRARLGAAMSLLASGDVANGVAGLKPLADDSGVESIIRAEASYHLATLAKEAGHDDEVRKYADQATRADPSSLWAQRAFTLKASLAAETKPASPLAPVLTLPTGK